MFGGVGEGEWWEIASKSRHGMFLGTEVTWPTHGLFILLVTSADLKPLHKMLAAGCQLRWNIYWSFSCKVYLSEELACSCKIVLFA